MTTLRRQNYSDKTISVYEIIGSYIVDVFYNHLYANAKQTHMLKHKSDSTRSLTDEYKTCLLIYYNGITTDKKYYEQAVKGMLEHYRTFTKFTTISMRDFISEVVKQFVPEEHFAILTQAQTQFFLNKLIKSIVEKFIGRVSQIGMMMLIIDDHANVENPRVLIDAIVDIMIIEREELFNELISDNSGQNGTCTNTDHVSIEVVKKITQDRDAIWNELQNILATKCKLESDLKKAKAIVEILHSKNQAYEKAIEAIKKEKETDSIDKFIDDVRSEPRGFSMDEGRPKARGESEGGQTSGEKTVIFGEKRIVGERQTVGEKQTASERQTSGEKQTREKQTSPVETQTTTLRDLDESVMDEEYEDPLRNLRERLQETSRKKKNTQTGVETVEKPQASNIFLEGLDDVF